MKIKLTKGDLKFLFNNYAYFEEFMRLMRNLRILLAEDLRFELEEDEKR